MDMIIQQIRNATVKIRYSNVTFLVDPWFQDQGTGFSAKAVRPEMQGIKCPMNALPDTPESILNEYLENLLYRLCVLRIRCAKKVMRLYKKAKYMQPPKHVKALNTTA